ncbi:hypothetical protein GCM10010390_11120 [Streptomyces mordarskii]|uniref:Uncharacterized protein n=1 Tax=Streptomyces mordarskii TaxID=1226758 RepID=A0ABP3LZX4_9ACTN
MGALTAAEHGSSVLLLEKAHARRPFRHQGAAPPAPAGAPSRTPLRNRRRGWNCPVPDPAPQTPEALETLRPGAGTVAVSVPGRGSG